MRYFSLLGRFLLDLHTVLKTSVPSGTSWVLSCIGVQDGTWGTPHPYSDPFHNSTQDVSDNMLVKETRILYIPNAIYYPHLY